MSDVYLGCIACRETEVLKVLEQFLYSHMGHDLRFADLDSFKEILQSKLEKSGCWAYRESPEEYLTT